MSRVLIDPQVGPYHSREDIEAWIAELRERLRSADGAAKGDIDRSIEQAEGWLVQKGDG